MSAYIMLYHAAGGYHGSQYHGVATWRLAYQPSWHAAACTPAGSVASAVNGSGWLAQLACWPQPAGRQTIANGFSIIRKKVAMAMAAENENT
jgi:hypothetical protein